MKYSYGIIFLHWTTTALMFALAASGILYSYKIVGSNALIFHQWGGQILLVLVFIWIGVRLAFGVGPSNSDHLWWEKMLAALVKITLYILLLLMSSLAMLRPPALKALSYCFQLMLPSLDLI